MKPPLSSSFLLTLVPFPSFFFPRLAHAARPSPRPSPPGQGPDQSMRDFCAFTGPTVRGAALPSKDTKTCREHREQETTNCCKLRNTKARASRSTHRHRGRVLRLSRAFFRHSALLTAILRENILVHSLVSSPLLIVMQFCPVLSPERDARPRLRPGRPTLRILIGVREKDSSDEAEVAFKGYSITMDPRS